MIGKTLSHYKITAELGRGGMGIVYKAEDLNLDREVAIKVLPPSTLASEDDRARFYREAKAAATLNHPNIAQIYNLDLSVSDHPLIVMELVHGETVAALIEKGELSIEEAVRITLEATEGLQAAHDEGIVHRDIKPANLMVSESGQVKVLDFGLAKHREGIDITKSGHTTGTAAYMSPEQISGKPVDPRSDIWSLGVTLYEMLCGERPFAGEYEAAVGYSILNTVVKPVTEGRDGIPETVAAALSRSMQKKPDERFQSASAFKAALRESLPGFVAERTAAASPVARPWPVVLGVGIALVVMALAALWYDKQQELTRARVELLPQIEQLADAGRYHDAFLVAEEAGAVLAEDSVYQEVLNRYTDTVSVTTEPSGATLWVQIGEQGEGTWRELGTTPIENVRLPSIGYSEGVVPMRLSADGYHDVFRLLGAGRSDVEATLINPVDIPDGMIPIPASPGPARLYLPGMEHLPMVPVKAFFLDETEVTNAEYQAFLDDEGYTDDDLWAALIGESASLSEAYATRAAFTDLTGRPGPSTWQTGRFAQGEEEFPVAGVSWFEAAAFCAWTGNQLPTLYHWNFATATYLSEYTIPRSNISGSALQAVGTTASRNVFGTYDLVGNVREWIFNQVGVEGNRGIMGGSWRDEDYVANSPFALPPHDRSAENGFRCARMRGADWNEDGQMDPVARELPYFASVEPVDDATFSIYKRMYMYDRTPLQPVVLETGLTETGLRYERIEYDSGYGGQRIQGILVLPDNVEPPYQAVIVFYGAYALQTGPELFKPDILLSRWFTFLLEDGRAMFFPRYQGTFGRGPGVENSYPDMTRNYLDHVIMWSKDLGRSVDYLESRPDIDADRLGYMGGSWGARIAGTLLGVEHRFKAALLALAGIRPQRSQPEADPVHFLPHVETPTRIVGGNKDFLFPVETSQRPFYEALTLPEEDKDWKTFEGGHFVPNVDLIRETLSWFDKYMGPTR